MRDAYVVQVARTSGLRLDRATVSLHMAWISSGGGGKCGLMSGWTNSQRDGKFDSISHAGGKIRGAILTGAGRKTLHPRTLLSLCLSPRAAVVGLGSPMYFALNLAIVCLHI